MRAVVLDDVVVIAEPQDLYFLLDGVDFGEAAGGQYFDGVEVARALVQRLGDGPVCALAQDIQQLVLLFGVRGLCFR